ncbi:MAG: Ig-like domain-containing protein, partial [Alphaproteobacteria bacterium]
MRITLLNEGSDFAEDITQQVIDGADVVRLVEAAAALNVTLSANEVLVAESGMLYVLDGVSGDRYLLGPISGDLYVNDERTYVWDVNTDWLGARFFDPTTQEWMEFDLEFWLNYNSQNEEDEIEDTLILGSRAVEDTLSSSDIDDDVIEDAGTLFDGGGTGDFGDDDDEAEEAVTDPSAPIPLMPTLSYPVGDYLNEAWAEDPTLKGTARAENEIEVTLTVTDKDGKVTTQTLTTTSDAAGNWSLPIDKTTLKDGSTVSVQATATNEDGEQSAATPSKSFKVDLNAPDAPKVNDDTVGADGYISADDTILTGEAEEGSTVLVTVSDNNGEKAIYEVVVSADEDDPKDGLGNWEIDLDTATPVSGKITIDEGEKVTLNITAKDAAGNESDPATGFPKSGTVDTKAPESTTIDKPIDGAAVVTNDFPIEGKGEPNSVIELVLTDGANGNLNLTVTANADQDGYWTLDKEKWDGTNLAKGENLTVTATATDKAGNESAPTSSVIAHVEPGMSINQPVANDKLNDLTPTITGAADVNMVVTVTLSDDRGESAIYTVTADVYGGWVLDLDDAAPASGSISFDEGETMSVTASDSSDPVKTASVGGITFDVTPPESPAITKPAPGGGTADETPEITGTAESGSTVLVTVSDGINTHVYTTTASTDGDWTVDVKADDVDFEPGETATITTTATDDAGNVSKPATANFDILPPSDGKPVITSPDAGSAINDSTPVITGSAASDAVVAVTVSDGGTDQQVYTVTADGEGDWSLDLGADSTSPKVGLDDGETATITASAQNEKNETLVSDPVSFGIDTTDPYKPDITSPSKDTAGADPEITGSAEANSTVLVTVDDGDSEATYQTTADKDGQWTVDLDTDQPVDGTVDPENGEEVTISATATDGAGNVSGTTEVKYTVDSEAPDAPGITSPPDGGGVLDGTPAIEGTAEAGSTVNVVVGSGDTAATYQTTADTDGNWELDLETAEPASGTKTSPLTGDVSITATATDEAGNVSDPTSTGFEVTTVNNNVPNITSPDKGEFINDLTPEITGLANAGHTVLVTLSDGGLTATYRVIADDQGSWKVDIGTQDPMEGSGDLSLESGETATVTATAIDDDGKTSDSSEVLNFILDQDRPDQPTVDDPPFLSYIIKNDPLISGTAEPSVEGHSNMVLVTISDGTGKQTYTTTVDTQGKWSLNLEEAGNAPAFGIDDGENITVYARTVDAAGNKSKGIGRTKFTYFDLEPEGGPELKDPVDEGISTDKPVLKGVAVAGVEVRVTLTDDDTGDQATSAIYVVTASPLGYWELDLSTAQPLEGGKVSLEENDTVTATATAVGYKPKDDGSGYTDQPNDVSDANLIPYPDPADNNPHTFVVDTTPPTAPDLTDPDGATNETPTKLVGTAEANVTVLVTLSDGNTTISYEVESDTKGNWTLDFDAVDPLPNLEDGDVVPEDFDLSDGSFTVTMTAVDAVDRTSPPATESFTVDKVAPNAPLIDSPSDAGVVTDDFKIEGNTGTPGEPNSLVKVTLSDDDGKSIVLDATTDENGKWSVDANILDGTEFAVGDALTITATVTDLAGNISGNSDIVNATIKEPAGGKAIIDDPGVNTSDSAEVAISDKYTVTGRAPADAEKVELIVDDGDGNKWTYIAEVNGGAWEVDLSSGTEAGTKDFDEGETLTLTAVPLNDDDSSAGTNSDPRMVKTDLTAPDAPIITAPSDNHAFSNDEFPAVTGTAAADADYVIVTVKDQFSQIQTYRAAVTNGTWSIDIDEGKFTLDDGDAFNMSAQAYDKAGNVSEKSTTINVIYDPVVSGKPELTYPADEDQINNATPILTGVAESNATVFITVDDGKDDQATFKVVAGADGSWSLNLKADATTTGGAYNGFDNDDSVTIKLSADNKGNGTVVAQNVSYNFKVDTDNPDAPTLTTPDQSDSSPKFSPDGGVVGTAEPNSTVLVTISDGTETATYQTTADPAGNFSLDVTSDPIDGTISFDEKDTDIDIDVTATDEAGNVSDPRHVDATIDLSPPAAPSITTPGQGANVNDATPLIEGKAEAGSEVLITINDQDGNKASFTAAVGTDGLWHLNLDDHPAATSFIGNGDQLTIQAVAVDDAGNQSPSTSREFDIVIIPEDTITIDSPADASKTNDTEIDITGTAGKNSTVLITLDDANGQVGTFTVTADGNGNFTLDLEDKDSYTVTGDTISFDNGETITINASIEGSSSTASSKFTVEDKIVKMPAITSPSEGQDVNDTTPIITGTAESGTTILVTLSDGTSNATATVTTTSNGTWTLDTEAAGIDDLFQNQETATITAYAQDAAGTVSQNSATVKFDIVTYQPGEVTVDKPVANQPTNDDTPEISGSADPGSVVSVTLSDGDGTATYEVTTGTNGQWSLDLGADPAPAPKDSSGTFKPENGETITVDASVTAGGNTTKADQISFDIDTTPPASISLNDVADHIDDASPLLSGTGEAGSTIALTISESGLSASFEVIVGLDGNWQIDNFDTPLDGGNAEFLKDGGAISVSATAHDDAGNKSNTVSDAFEIDVTAPEAPAIITPSNGSKITTATPAIIGAGESGTEILVVLDDDEPGKATYKVTVGDNSTWTLDLSGTPAPAPIDGRAVTIDDNETITVTAQAVDKAGNESPVASSNFTFTNPTSEDPSFAAPAEGTAVDPARDGLIVEGTATKDSSLHVIVADGSSNDLITYRVTGDINGAWKLDLASATPVAPDGAKPIYADDADLTFTLEKTAGGKFNPTPTLKLDVDSTAPDAPIFTDPADGALVASADPVIKGEAEANSTVLLTLTDKDNNKGIFTATADGDGKWEYDIPADSEFAIAKGETLSLTATATDALNHTSTPKTSSFTYPTDANSGEVKITDPASDSTIGGSDPFVVKGTGTPGEVISLTIADDDGGSKVETITVTPSGGWSYTITDLSAFDFARDGADIQHGDKLTYTATMGTSDPAIATYTVDLDAPSVPNVTSPAENSLADPTPIIVGTGQANTTVLVTLIDQDGISKSTYETTTNAAGNWTLDTDTGTPFEGGTYAPDEKDTKFDVEVQGVDEYGNASNGNTFNYSMDLAKPDAPTLTSPSSAAILGTLTPTLEGAAEANSTVTLTLNDDDGAKQTYVITANGDGAWSLDLSATPFTATNDKDVFTAVMTATDAAGNVSDPSAPSTYTVNASADLTIQSPANGDEIGTSFFVKEDHAEIKGVGTPGAVINLTIVETETDGSKQTTNFTATVGANGNWEIDLFGDGDNSPKVDFDDGSTIAITATQTADGQVSPPVTTNVTYDLTPPTSPSVSSPVAGTNQSDSDPVITGIAAADAEQVIITLTDGATTLTATVSVSAGNTWTLETEADGELKELFQAGEKATITATAVDKAGNISNGSDPHIFNIVSSTPGVPTITDPSNGDAINNQGDHLVIKGSALDSEGNFVFLTLTDGTDTATFKSQIIKDGVWVADLGDETIEIIGNSADFNILTSFTDGETITATTAVYATVNGDNRSDPQYGTPTVFTIDTSVTTPIVDNVASSNDITPTITGTAEAGSTVLVTLSEGDDAAATYQVTAGDDGKWTLDTEALDPLAGGSEAFLEDGGEISITASQTDRAGNVSGNSDPKSFIIDKDAPAIAIESPAAGSTTTKNDPIISGTAEAAAVILVTLTDDATPKQSAIYETKADGDGKWSLNLADLGDNAVQLSGSISIDKGETVTVNATAADRAGNVSDPATSSFTYKEANVEISNPAKDEIIDPVRDHLKIDGIAAKPNAEVLVTLADDGGQTATLTVTTDENGSWALDLELEPNGLVKGESITLSDGETLSITASQEDNGETKTDTRTGIKIDTAAPDAPSIDYPANDGLVTSVEPVISGTVEAGATVLLTVSDGTVDGAIFTIIDADGDGAWTYDFANDGNESFVLEHGEKLTINATAKDAAGHDSDAANNIATVYTTLPADPTILTPADKAIVGGPDPLVFTGFAQGFEEVYITLTDNTGDVEFHIYTLDVDAGGTWSLDLADYDSDVLAFEHGDEIKAEISAKNIGGVEKGTGITLGFDQEGAATSLNTPDLDGDGFVESNENLITGTAEAGATILVTLADGDNKSTYQVTAAENGNWTVDAKDGEALDGGKFEFKDGATMGVTATATDALGNVGDAATVGDPIKIDLEAPDKPALTSPSGGNTTFEYPKLEGTAEAGATVLVTLSEGGWIATYQVTADDKGDWDIVLNPAEGTNQDKPIAETGEYDFNGLENDTDTKGDVMTVVMTATDGAGNVSDAETTNFERLDFSGKPIITSPEAGSASNDPTFTVTGIGADNDIIVIRIKTKDGEEGVYTVVPDLDNKWTLDLETATPDPTSTLDENKFKNGIDDDLITITATSKGNEETSDPVIFTLDTKAPDAPVFVNPTSGSTTDDLTPEVTGTAEKNSTILVTVSETNADGTSGHNQIYTVNADDDGKWTLDFEDEDTAKFDIQSSDRLNYSATATDAVGNISTASETYNLIYYNRMPGDVLIAEPANGIATNDTTPYVSGFAANEGKVLITLSATGIAPQIFTTQADSEGSWSFNFDDASDFTLANSTDSDGDIYTISMTSTDATGKVEAADPKTFTLDTVAPEKPSINAEQESVIDGAVGDATPALLGKGEAGATVFFTVTDGTETATFKTTADENGNWTTDFDEAEKVGGDITLSDGEDATITATQVDSAGNVSPASDQTTVKMDLSSSTPIIDPIPDLVGMIDPSFTGTAEAGAVVTLTFTEQASTGAGEGKDQDVVTMTVTANAEGKWTVDLGDAVKADGFDGFDDLDEISMEVVATDKYGNKSETATAEFTIDFPVGPEIDAPAKGSIVNSKVISGRYSADPSQYDGQEQLSGELLVTIADNNAEIATYTVQYDAGSETWSLDLDDPSTYKGVTGSITLADKEVITVTVSAKEGEANEPSPQRITTYTMDLVAPDTPAILSPADDVASSDLTPEISGTAEAGSTILLTVADADSEATYQVIADGEGKWTFDAEGPTQVGESDFSFDDGDSLTITATASDVAGNVSGATDPINLVLDATPPTKPTVDALGNDPYNLLNNATAPITGTAEAGSTVLVTIADGTNDDADGVSSAIFTVAADAETGKWSLDLSTDENQAKIKLDHDEMITVSATATDKAGNISESSDAETAEMDLNTSNPAITSPVDGVFVGSGKPLITGTAEAFSTLFLTLTDDGDSETAIYTLSADKDGAWTLDATNTEPNVGEIKFEHLDKIDIDVNSKDRAGNASGNVTDSFFNLWGDVVGELNILYPSPDELL